MTLSTRVSWVLQMDGHCSQIAGFYLASIKKPSGTMLSVPDGHS
jgi:hypothetical protein